MTSWVISCVLARLLYFFLEINCQRQKESKFDCCVRDHDYYKKISSILWYFHWFVYSSLCHTFFSVSIKKPFHWSGPIQFRFLLLSFMKIKCQHKITNSLSPNDAYAINIVRSLCFFSSSFLVSMVWNFTWHDRLVGLLSLPMSGWDRFYTIFLFIQCLLLFLSFHINWIPSFWVRWFYHGWWENEMHK